MDEALQAQLDAQAEELVRLNTEIENLRSENTALRGQVETINQRSTANSASVVTEKPAAPVKPEVEIDGARFRFKMGEFNAGGKVYSATQVAEDAELLATIYSKYPGLFERI